MDQYVTGAAIKRLREAQRITQGELACVLNVSDKAVSKWETGRGYPDITLLEPLAKALKTSVAALFSGESVINCNVAANMTKTLFYVCPVCGNIISMSGAALVSCCGITLPALEAETPDAAHQITCERVEDETYITVSHAMTKEHYISFLAFVTGDRCQLVKLYPEGEAQARFQIRGHGWLYAYCNRHGLVRQRI